MAVICLIGLHMHIWGTNHSSIRFPLVLEELAPRQCRHCDYLNHSIRLYMRSLCVGWHFGNSNYISQYNIFSKNYLHCGYSIVVKN
mgnify:FL=1